MSSNGWNHIWLSLRRLALLIMIVMLAFLSGNNWCKTKHKDSIRCPEEHQRSVKAYRDELIRITKDEEMRSRADSK